MIPAFPNLRNTNLTQKVRVGAPKTATRGLGLTATALLLFCSLLLANHGSAGAVTRSCKWNITDVPVYVNLTTFTDRGYEANDVLAAVYNAINTWYEEGGANIRPYYAGTTAASGGSPGQINIVMEDWVGFSACFLGWAGWGNDNCDQGGTYIVLFDKLWYNCPKAPVNWTGAEYPPAQYFSMQDVLTHEFGHALGGYSDDYSNSVTVMQAATAGAAVSSHLYNVDMDLLRDGNPGTGQYAYGRRANTFVKNKYSAGTSWTQLSTNIGTSSLKPAAAGGSVGGNSYVVGFVDQNSNIITKTGDGVSWPTVVTHPYTSRVGLGMAKTTSYYVLAFTEATDDRKIYVRRSSNTGATWGETILINASARSQSPPALAWNSSVGRLLAVWVDRNNDRLYYATSSDEGATWSSVAEVISGTPEGAAFSGPSLSCNSSNQCLLVWPTWHDYRGISPSNNICTMNVSVSGANFVTSDRRCGGPTTRSTLPDLVINSGRAPGVAYGSTGTFAGWILGRAGRMGIRR
jgi:hypothetical protein